MLALSSASFSFAPTMMAAPTTQRASVVMEVRCAKPKKSHNANLDATPHILQSA